MTAIKNLKVTFLILALLYSCGYKNTGDVRPTGQERIDTLKIVPIPNFTDTTSMKVIPLE